VDFVALKWFCFSWCSPGILMFEDGAKAYPLALTAWDGWSSTILSSFQSSNFCEFPLDWKSG